MGKRGNEEMDWKWSSFVYFRSTHATVLSDVLIPSRLRPARGPDSYLHTQPVHHDPCLEPCLNIIQIIIPLRVELARALSWHLRFMPVDLAAHPPACPGNLAVIVWTH